MNTLLVCFKNYDMYRKEYQMTGEIVQLKAFNSKFIVDLRFSRKINC